MHKSKQIGIDARLGSKGQRARDLWGLLRAVMKK